jgi:hypothetical protein
VLLCGLHQHLLLYGERHDLLGCGGCSLPLPLDRGIFPILHGLKIQRFHLHHGFHEHAFGVRCICVSCIVQVFRLLLVRQQELVFRLHYQLVVDEVGVVDARERYPLDEDELLVHRHLDHLDIFHQEGLHPDRRLAKYLVDGVDGVGVA